MGLASPRFAIPMLFSPRIRLKSLAQLCHRLQIATSAGIEDRKIWHDESARGSRSQRYKIGLLSDQLASRKSLTEALPATGNFFPPLFCQMVEVGEMSGQLDRTYARLAKHYDRMLAARRNFLGRLSWPMLQLAMALLVIGLLIVIMGVLPINTGPQGEQIDILGLGLVGTPGLIKYVNSLIVISIALLLVVEAARRGVGWTRTLQRWALQIPIIGGAMKTLALSRFTWALQLVLDTPMDLRRALPLALETTGNDYYARHAHEVAQRIEQGQDLHTSLASTEVFPIELLDSIAVGEQSGRLVETMERQSVDYQERAGVAISVLAQAAGYFIWLLVALFVLSLIFRIASFYTQQLNNLL